MTEKQDPRKADDGSAGPRPQGLRQGETIDGEELHKRASFLSEVQVKVVEPPKDEKPKGSTRAQTKGYRA